MATRFTIAVALVLAFAGVPNAHGLELKDCRITAGPEYPGIKARCGDFERPLDPSLPGGDTIRLHVVVVPALTLNPAPDPVVPIAGGPGQATTEFYAAQAGAFEALRRDRDILLVDQRGTGESAPLDCAVDEDVVQGQLSREQTLEATQACLDALDHDPRFFTTSVAVRDLEAVRSALGYGPLNLYGVSYGSRVAQHFARRYPDATRSVILDGVVPPQMALGPAIATEAQRALDSIFERCAEDEACATAFPELDARFAALEERLSGKPASVTLPHPVTAAPESLEFGGDELAGVIRMLSYQPTTVALIPLLVDAAADGNFVPLAAQYLSIRDSFAEALSGGMHNAVVCTEDAPFFAGEAISDEDLAATYMGPMLHDVIETMCSIWPAGVMDDDLKRPLDTSIPVLMLSGEADPITPPEYAELAAVELDNVLLLTGRRQGHGLAPRGCTRDVMAEFVAQASVTDVDAGCFERHFAMPFFLDFPGPAP